MVGLAAIVVLFAAVHERTAFAQKVRAPTRSVWDGVYTQAQADRGEDAYRQKCVDCHGEDLGGDQDMATPLTGGAFMSNWNGLTVGDLFERIRMTMPLNYPGPGTLSKESISDILAYILSYNKFPAGQTELPRDKTVLKMITIQSMKPDQK